eukprot:7181007-Prymnesium_polylepis.1
MQTCSEVACNIRSMQHSTCIIKRSCTHPTGRTPTRMEERVIASFFLCDDGSGRRGRGGCGRHVAAGRRRSGADPGDLG